MVYMCFMRVCILKDRKFFIGERKLDESSMLNQTQFDTILKE